MIRKKYIKRIYRSVAEVLHDVVGWVLVLFLLRRKDNGSSTSMSLSRLGVQVKLLLGSFDVCLSKRASAVVKYEHKEYKM